MITASYYDTKINEQKTIEYNTDKKLVDNQIIHCIKDKVGYKYFKNYCRDLKIER